MTIDSGSGRIAFPEVGLAVDGGLTRRVFLSLPVAAAAVCLPRVRHDPTFRYQLPAVPQPESTLYAVLQFHYERLLTISLFHHVVRFDHAGSADPVPFELARRTFHEHWLAAQFGVACRRYAWGEIVSRYDAEAGASSIVVEYARISTWQLVGRAAGRVWGSTVSRHTR